MAAGISPALWAAYISAGSGVAILSLTLVSGTRESITKPIAVYSAISGLLSYVFPNLLTFLVIPKIGSGLTAIMFALSPVVTALLSIAVKVRPPSLAGLAGIALGLLGALTIILARPFDRAQDSSWILIGMLIPVFLGVGNVYRTRAWPADASPLQLAALTNLAAVVPLAMLFLFGSASPSFKPLISAPLLASLQLLISVVMFLMFFRLQQVGGPTYLSQIGYVGAVVGVAVGVVFLGESYPASVWAGAAVIACGIALNTVSMLRQDGRRQSAG